MKANLYIFITIIITLIIGDKNTSKKYIYSTQHFFESIELNDDNSFIYFFRQEFISQEIKGNYNLRGDSLILDSHPQRDKIIVKELRKGNKNVSTISVTDKSDRNIHYNLNLILNDNTEVLLKDQWEKSKIKNLKIKAFYVTDSKGLKSPIYYKKGEFSNYYKIKFETNRIFENEAWLIKNNRIKPRGLNGEFQNYFLER